jgi:hypothetical protein
MSRPLAIGLPVSSNSLSIEASAMNWFQSVQPGVLPGNFAWYLSRFTTTPPYSRLYSTGSPFSLPPQVEPARGAAKNVFWASGRVSTSSGTSSRLAANPHTSEGGISTRS